MEKKLKILDRLGQTLLGTPHMPTYNLFEKSWFSEVQGTLWQVPWGPGEVEMKKNLKTLDGLDNTLPMTPHLLY